MTVNVPEGSLLKEGDSMEKILFVDACARKQSRTRALAEHLLGKLNGECESVSLDDALLRPLDDVRLEWRSACCERGDFADPYFDKARQFAAADTIVIAAPFWDNSFPAVLKKYIESVCVTGITFRYGENGIPQGLCRAKRLYYVTTAGGRIFCEAYSFGYIKDLAETMFGIGECVLFKAEELDIIGADEAKIMEKAKAAVSAFLAREA